METFTIARFNKMFPDEWACLEYVKDTISPDGIACRSCQKVTKHHRVASRRSYSCDYCGHHVHPTAGTIFHKSVTPLRDWFYAMFQMASTRCGISAKQLERELGVTYKTAWRMFREIRKLMNEDRGPLTGQVEMDETYVGGEVRGRGRGYNKNKTLVIGAVQRGGDVRTGTGTSVSHAEIKGFLTENISPEVTTIFTDEHPTYKFLDKTGVAHETVAHRQGEYVRGAAHTNSVEGFWSLAKRGIDGVYHQVSPQYLPSYMNEYGFRYNHRHDAEPMFEALMARVPACATDGTAQAS